MKKTLLFACLCAAYGLGRAQVLDPNVPINEGIKIKFIEMLQNSNVLLSQNEKDELRKSCDENEKEREKLEKKPVATRSQKEKSRLKELSEPCDKLEKDSKMTQKFIAKFPKPADDDSEKYNKANCWIGGMDIGLLGVTILEQKSLTEIKTGRHKTMHSFPFAGDLTTMDTRNFAHFRFNYNSEKFILAELENDFNVTLGFLQSNLENDFKFEKENMINYDVVGGRFRNNIYQILTKANRMGIDGYYEAAIPVLKLWEFYSENEYKDYYMINDVDVIFIKKNTSNLEAIDTRNKLSIDAGYGMGIFNFENKSNFEFNLKESTKYQMAGYDIIFRPKGKDFYYPLPTPEKLKKAWEGFLPRGQEPSLTFPYDEAAEVILKFGPAFHQEGNGIIKYDTVYTAKELNKINPLYGQIAYMISVTPAVLQSGGDNGFVDMSVRIKPDAKLLSELSFSKGNLSIDLPIRLYYDLPVNKLELARIYTSVKLELSSDAYPVFSPNPTLKGEVKDDKINFIGNFRCIDKKNIPASDVNITFKSISNNNAELLKDIRQYLEQPRSLGGGNFTFSYSTYKTKLTEPVELICDFSVSVNGKAKSYNNIKITLQPPTSRYGEESGTLVSMNEISGLIKTNIPLSDSAKKHGIDSLLNEGVIRQNNFGNYLRVNQK